jgi:hypothetical protein
MPVQMIVQLAGATSQKSGHFAPVPQRGHLVVPRERAAHDGAVLSTAQLPAGIRRVPCASMRAFLGMDLEWYWPSRRGHAYDEFCR